MELLEVPTPEVAEAPAAPTADAPVEERFEVEFPAELAAGPPDGDAEPSAPPSPEPTPVATAPRPVPPAPAAPAPDARATRYRSVAEQAETARQRYADEHVRTQAAAEADRSRRARGQRPDFDKVKSLNEIADYVQHETAVALRLQREALRQEMIERTVTISERHLRALHEDYDAVLERSGVATAITMDAQGRVADPALWRAIFESPDPAETAYAVASERLAGAGRATPGAAPSVERVTEAERRGVERGRAEVVTQIHAVGRQPRGLRALPGSPTQKASYALTDIEGMSDDQKMHIKRTRPDIWRRFMESA
jgi:hypothetical protein